MVSRQTENLPESLANGVSLVCHAENWVKNISRLRPVKYGPAERSSYHKLLYNGNRLSTSAVVVSKKSLISVGCFTTNVEAIGVEDYHLWLKLAKKLQVCIYRRSFGAYRIHDYNQSSNVFRQMRSEKWVLKTSLLKIQNTIFILKLLKLKECQDCIYLL